MCTKCIFLACGHCMPCVEALEYRLHASYQACNPQTLQALPGGVGPQRS